MIHSIAGIDYGNGLTNIDLTTGVRYGVISKNNCNQDWLSVFDDHYADEGTPAAQGNGDEYWNAEPTHFTYERDGIKAQYSPDSSWVWVLASPVIVECKFCSPCVPGAGDLDNQVAGGVKTYGLPDDCLEKA